MNGISLNTAWLQTYDMERENIEHQTRLVDIFIPLMVLALHGSKL